MISKTDHGHKDASLNQIADDQLLSTEAIRLHWVSLPFQSTNQKLSLHDPKQHIQYVLVTSSQTSCTNLNHWTAVKKWCYASFKSEAKQSGLIDDQHSLTLMRPCCPRPGPVQFIRDFLLTAPLSLILFASFFAPLLGLSLLVLITSPPNGTDER